MMPEVQWLFDLPFLIFGIRLGVLWPNENPCVRVAQMDLFYIYISRTVSFLYEVKGKIPYPRHCSPTLELSPR